MTPATDEEQVREQIATELDRVQAESYGVGANSIEVTISENLVVAVIDPILAPNEQTLMDAGRAEAVKAVREEYQRAINSTFTAIVEHATGRRVVGFMSAVSVDPFFAVELFRLDPA